MVIIMMMMMMIRMHRNSEGHTPLMFAVGQGGLNCARYQHILIVICIITIIIFITIVITIVITNTIAITIAITIVIITIVITTIIVILVNILTIIINKLVFFSQLLMVEGIDLETRDGMGLTLEEVAR